MKTYKVDDCRLGVLNQDELRRGLTAAEPVALMCRMTLITLGRISEVLALR